MKNEFRGAVYLSLAAGIWGGMYVVSKYALATIPPFTLLFLRYFFASAVLFAICKKAGLDFTFRQDKGAFFKIGFFGYFLSIGAQFAGTKLSSAHMGAVVTALSPVFQSCFAVFLLKEKINMKQITAMALSLLGVIIIVGIPGVQNGKTSVAGSLCLMAAALFWGYYSIVSKSIVERHSALKITTLGIMMATAFTLPAAILEFPYWNPANLFTVPMGLSVTYLSVVSTAGAFYCWNKGLSLSNPHQAGLFFFLQPIVGCIFGYLVLSEHLTASFFGGSLLVLSAVYIVMIPVSPNKAGMGSLTDGAEQSQD